MIPTNDCPADDLLQAILQGTLKPAETAQVDSHLASCLRCQQKLDAWTRSGDNSVQSSKQPPFTPDEQQALSKLMYRLQTDPPPEVGSRFGSSRHSQSLAADFKPEAPSDERVGHYRLLVEIGRGSSGRLFRAVDERLQRHVALKILRAELTDQRGGRTRLQREARAAALLKHDHIVSIYDVSLNGPDVPHIAYELIEGESLSNRLRRSNYLTPHEAARIAWEIATALNLAHEGGLVHRDVKPSNILLETATQRAKITDFGLARFDEQQTRLTLEGMIAGTPAYMSPEQVLHPHDVDARSDVYSLGIVLYEMLSGVIPFRGVVRMTLMQVLHEEPKPICQLNDDVPADLETICAKAMAKETQRRYQSARLLADDLQRFLAGNPILARPIGPLERLWRLARRNPRIASLSAALGFLLMAVAIGSTLFAVKLASTQQAAYRARRAAQHNANTAERQRNEALETLHRLVFEIYEDVKHRNTDVFATQKALLTTALEGLQKLTHSAAGSEWTDYSVAMARNRLGTALYGLGELEAAVTQFRTALETTDRLLKATPKNPTLLRLKTSVVANLGTHLARLGQNVEAQQQLATAIVWAHQLLSQEPQDYPTIEILAGVYRALGNLIEQTHPDEAISYYEESVDLIAQLVAAQPNHIELKQRLLQERVSLGKFELIHGRLSAAESRFQECLIQKETLRGISPTKHLQSVHFLLGELLANRDDLPRARTHYEKAWMLGAQLLEHSPARMDFLTTRVDLACRLAEVYHQLEKPSLALQWYHTAEATLQRWENQDNVSPERLAWFHGRLAEVARDLQKNAAAKFHLQTALGQINACMAADPGNLTPWQSLWHLHLSLQQLVVSPNQKKQWHDAAEQLLAKTAQQINRPQYPELSPWLQLAETQLDEPDYGPASYPKPDGTGTSAPKENAGP